MTPSGQLVLALGHHPSLAAADFVAAPSNAAALAWIGRYPDWPAPMLALHGPAGSGKSHLLHLWRKRQGAVLLAPEALAVRTLPALLGGSRAVALDFGGLDLAATAAPFDERALLHLYNMLADRRGHVLAAARAAPAHWRVALPDLRSRLAAAASVAIEAPDDALLAAVFGKLFADRQLRVPAGLIEYLVSRSERSLAAAGRVVEALDRAALVEQRALSTALAREVLERLNDTQERLPDL
jgi:chromosomal replication initiation ATPase DnaA